MISAASRKEALRATRIKYQQRLTPKQLSMLDDIPFTALFLILWAAVASGRAEWLWVHLLWNDARIQLDQNWQFQTRNDTDYHCTYALTTVNGSRMAFNFTGTEFIINGPETGAGRLDVYDNGREILNFDLPRITDDMSCGAELLRYPLPMGQHTIELIFRPNGVNDTYGIEYVWYSFPTSTASVTSATVTNTGATSAGSHRYSAEVVVGAALGGAFGFALLTALGWCLLRWRRANKSSPDEHDRFDMDGRVVVATNMRELHQTNSGTSPVNVVTTLSENPRVQPIIGQSNTTDSLSQPLPLPPGASQAESTIIDQSLAINRAESPTRISSPENRATGSQALREEDVQRIASALWDQRGLSRSPAPPPYREL